MYVLQLMGFNTAVAVIPCGLSIIVESKKKEMSLNTAVAVIPCGLTGCVMRDVVYVSIPP